MILRIKPEVAIERTCSNCSKEVNSSQILWYGMHIFENFRCLNCDIEITRSLPVGHGLSSSMSWLVDPPKNLTSKINHKSLEIEVEALKVYEKVIILNCIDYMYGHCLLKLLNTQRHLEDHPHYGLVIIIQPFLRWMVPEGVAEVWTVDIPLREGIQYYSYFNQFVQAQLLRFTEVYLSEAYSHPSRFDITKFTGVEKHDFHQPDVLITFVWREDRLWCHPFLERRRTLKALRLYGVILRLQNLRIRQLFKQISLAIPEADFAVAGLGKKTFFPNWIKDARVEDFDDLTEKQTCQLYSDSRLVIGVHGSSMLLPSAHAGMTIDLMPKDRWGNFAQDIIYQENDPRLSSFKYRYLPITMNVSMITYIAKTMVMKYFEFQSSMVN
jgi:hypothetical protein